MKKHAIIYGTAWKKENTATLVSTAWQHGFRAFDTACQPKHYREDLVGAALDDIRRSGVAREEMYIQTKYTPFSGQDPSNVPYDPSLPLAQQIEASFRQSQTNLRTDYLDCLILHSPLHSLEDTLSAWSALEGIVERGGAKQIGISNCYDMGLFKGLFEQATLKPSVLQNRFYPKTGYDYELREFCLHNDVTYQSFWTLTANSHILESPALFSIARQHRKTPAQIFFHYLQSRGIVPLTGTQNIEHMREDLECASFEIPKDQLALIDPVLRQYATH